MGVAAICGVFIAAWKLRAWLERRPFVLRRVSGIYLDVDDGYVLTSRHAYEIYARQYGAYLIKKRSIPG
jgi:hypothetical protein